MIIAIINLAVILWLVWMEVNTAKRRNSDLGAAFEHIGELERLCSDLKGKIGGLEVRLEVLENFHEDDEERICKSVDELDVRISKLEEEIQDGEDERMTASVNWQKGMENIMNYSVDSAFNKTGGGAL